MPHPVTTGHAHERNDGSGYGLACLSRREQIQNFPQTLANVLNLGGRLSGEWNGRLPLIGFHLRTQLLPRAHDREALFIEELLDSQDAFHIPPAVHALPGAAFYRLQLRELALPEAQHVGRKAAQRGHFPDAEIQLVRDENFIRLVFAIVLGRALFSRSHCSDRRLESQYCDTPQAWIRTISTKPNRPLEAALQPKTEMPLKRCFS